MNAKVKLAAIEDLSIRKPEDGKTYVVFRDVEPNSKSSKYSICVYRAGNWIPEIITNMKWSGFVGIPVTVEDKWINIEDAFESVDDEKPTHDSIDAQKVSNNELEDIKKIIDDHERRIQQLEYSNTSPLQPTIPAPYPPYTPYLKPGEITCTYNYVPSKENK